MWDNKNSYKLLKSYLLFIMVSVAGMSLIIEVLMLLIKIYELAFLCITAGELYVLFFLFSWTLTLAFVHHACNVIWRSRRNCTNMVGHS